MSEQEPLRPATPPSLARTYAQVAADHGKSGKDRHLRIYWTIGHVTELGYDPSLHSVIEEEGFIRLVYSASYRVLIPLCNVVLIEDFKCECTSQDDQLAEELSEFLRRTVDGGGGIG